MLLTFPELLASVLASMNDPVKTVMERIEALALISEEPNRLTRTFASPAMRKAIDLVASWMREAGMTVSEDDIGNLTGRYEGCDEWCKSFLLGSHLDTIRGSGKFNGALGILTAIAAVQELNGSNTRLPFAIEIVAFADSEGVRFQTAHLGSKALTGSLDEKDLNKQDTNGVTLADAIRAFGGDPAKLSAARRDPQRLLGYTEVHIEQGPVLEQKYQPVGVVTGISGQTCIRAHFVGQAGDAGTTPMNLRRDALAAAARFISAVEAAVNDFPGLVATVSQIDVIPGFTNIIPGEAILAVDVRHQQDHTRSNACDRLREIAFQTGEKRGIMVDWAVTHEVQSVPCSNELTAALSKAARRQLLEVTEMPSGSGHDAAIMGDITPVAMLLVRCQSGEGYYPYETVASDDVRAAFAVLNDFLQHLANQPKAVSRKVRI